VLVLEVKTLHCYSLSFVYLSVIPCVVSFDGTFLSLRVFILTAIMISQPTDDTFMTAPVLQFAFSSNRLERYMNTFLLLCTFDRGPKY
jgi:hypothetical protein